MEQNIHPPTLVSRVEDFDIPPESLDLLTATAEQLRPYGVPPRPDPELQQDADHPVRDQPELERRVYRTELRQGVRTGVGALDRPDTLTAARCAAAQA